MAEKFLENIEMDEIRELMKMTRLGQMLRAEGREEGRAEERYQNLISKILERFRRIVRCLRWRICWKRIRKLCRRFMILQFLQGAECDVELIYQELMQNKNKQKE